MKLTLYRVACDVLDGPADTALVLVCATRTGEVLVLDSQRWRQLQDGDDSGFADHELHVLIQAELLVPDHEDESDVILRRHHAMRQDSCTLDVVAPLSDVESRVPRCVDELRQKLADGGQRPLRIFWYTNNTARDAAELRDLLAALDKVEHTTTAQIMTRIIAPAKELHPTLVEEVLAGGSSIVLEVADHPDDELVDSVEALWRASPSDRRPEIALSQWLGCPVGAAFDSGDRQPGSTLEHYRRLTAVGVDLTLTPEPTALRCASRLPHAAQLAETCRVCALLPLCGGGCSHQWESRRPPCPPLRWSFESRLRAIYECSMSPHGRHDNDR